MTALFAAMLSSCKDDVPVFSVTFDSKGGTPIATQIVERGGKVEQPETPTLNSYWFAGWTMEDDAASSLWDFVNGTVIADMRLYAKWVQNLYPVTVTSAENGTARANATSAAMGELIRLEAIANNGYRFIEWQIIEGGINLSNTTDNPAAFIMPDEVVQVKALFMPYQVAPFKLYQSYAASPDGIHEWNEIEAEYTITRLPDLPMRTGYGYTDGIKLKFRNMAHGDRHYQYINDYTAYESVSSSMLRFQSATHEFYFSGGYVYARLLSNPAITKRIQIAETSFVYTYAQRNNDVLATTNWGEVLIFRYNDNEWYRMPMVQPDVYEVTPGAPMQTERNGMVQFYCYIIYQGRSLLGEFPSGKIFEFTGSVLQVSDMSPSEELLLIPPEFAGQRKEAQSMAIYGGDLFVGYWPDGVILRYDHKQKQWSRFTRLFDFPAEGVNIRDYRYNSSHSAFYGQRVAALVPFEDVLYAVTSNLNGWHDDIVPSPLLSEEQIRQYGAVYKIYRPGCRTIYFPR